MKKFFKLITALLLIASMAAFTGCGSQTEDPGPPPADVINPENSGDMFSEESTSDSVQNESSTQNENGETLGESDIL